MRCMCALVGSAIKYKCFCMVRIPLQNTLLLYYVNAEQNMYQFPLMFRISDQRPLRWTSAKRCPNLTTALSFCLFSSIVRYQDIVATAKKKKVKVCRETACSVYTKPHSKHWTYASEHVVIAKLLSGKHKWVIPKNPLCWGNVISEYTGICTLQSVSRRDYFGDLLESR